jgi:outer membrane protein TolC
MQMKKFLIYSFLVFAFMAAAYGQDVKNLTYEQALETMKTHNAALKSAAKDKEAQEYNRKSTRGLYLPKVSLSATYMKFDQDIGLDISPISDAIGDIGNVPDSKMLPSKLVLQKEQFSVASVNMLWPVFNGGKIRAANKAMDANINEALYKIEQTENALKTELVERYYGYRLAEKAVQLYKSSYDAMLLHLDNAKKMEDNGMISKAQRLYVELSVSNAKMEWQKAQRQANTVKQALTNTLGDSSVIQPVSELFLIENLEPVTFFQKAAIANNPLLKQVGSKKNLARQNYNIKRSDYLPSVAIIGNRELYHHDLSDLMPEWFVGVNMRWTIFDGISRTYKVKSAKATVDMVDFIQTKAQADIATYVNKLYNELDMQIEQLATMEKTYEFASEYLRVQKKAFAEGFATSKDVVDAELTLSRVKIGRIKVMNDYVLGLAKLLEVTGQTDLFLQYSQRIDRKGEEF